MGLKGFFSGLLVSAFVMALMWELMEMGVFQGQTDTFGGKILISLIIVIISKSLAKMLGG